MRLVGIDLGTRRIGVSVSDSDGVVATPHTVIERSGDDAADRAAIAALARDLGAGKLIVGLPLSLDGSRGPAAIHAAEEAAALESAASIPVELHDERLTTVLASRAPGDRSRNVRAGRDGKPGKRRVVDDAAATLILQSWIDVHGVHQS